MDLRRRRFSARSAWAAGFLAGLVLFSGCARSRPEASQAAPPPPDPWGDVAIAAGDPIVIGVSAALSGPYAAFGADVRDAVALALADRVQLRGFRLEMDAEDDGCSDERSAEAARALAGRAGLAGVIGSMCSSGSLPASDILAEPGIVMISPSSTAPDLTARGLENVFRTAWNDRLQGTAQARFARRRLKAARAVVVHDAGGFGTGVADAFRKTFAEEGGAVTLTAAIREGQTDFTALLKKIRAAQRDVIVFEGFAREAVPFLRQARQLGLTTAFLGPDDLDSGELVAAAGKAAEGIYLSAGQPGRGAGYDAFAARWRAKYGRPVGPLAAQAYDAARVLVEAIDRVAVTKDDGSLAFGRRALRDAVLAARLEGVSGPVAFLPGGDRVTGAEMVIKRIRGGRREVVATLTP